MSTIEWTQKADEIIKRGVRIGAGGTSPAMVRQGVRKALQEAYAAGRAAAVEEACAAMCEWCKEGYATTTGILHGWKPYHFSGQEINGRELVCNCLCQTNPIRRHFEEHK